MNIWRKWWLIEHGLWPKPKPPAPKPSEPTSRWTDPPWKGRGLHGAWVYKVGQYTPEQLADRCARAGFKWVAIEGNPAVENEQYFQAHCDAMHSRGLKAPLWERADTQKSFPEPRIDHVKRLLTSYPFDFYGADIEVFPVDDPGFPTEFAKAFPDLPRVAICAGFNDASCYTPWIEADFDAMTEAYSGPLGKPPVPGVAGSMDSDARWRGFKRNWLGYHSVPILEVNSENSASLEAQLPAVAQWSGNYSIWSAESMSDADWALLGA